MTVTAFFVGGPAAGEMRVLQEELERLGVYSAYAIGELNPFETATFTVATYRKHVFTIDGQRQLLYAPSDWSIHEVWAELLNGYAARRRVER